MEKTGYQDIRPYTTKDGSFIRELMHPDLYPGIQQSLAEATVPVGMTTRLHMHMQSNEMYHVTGGRGRLFLGKGQVEVAPGDTVYIPPGTRHKIENTGDVPLKILCFCCPAYAHEDTRLLT
jgi:mannose-6-phosphate isomerase-like protein (cupin superfamily)